MKQQLLDLAAEDMKADAADLKLIGDEVVSTRDPSKKIKISNVSGLKKRGLIVGIGYRGQSRGQGSKSLCSAVL